MVCFPEERMKEFVKKAIQKLIDEDYSDKNDEYYFKIMAAIDEIPVCGAEPKAESQKQTSYSGYQKESRKGRAPTARNIFIGHCMRKPEKDGLGLSMSKCSEKWKSMSEEEKAKYQP